MSNLTVYLNIQNEQQQIELSEQTEKNKFLKKINIENESSIPFIQLRVEDETNQQKTMMGCTESIDISANLLNSGQWIYYVKNLKDGISKGRLKFKISYLNESSQLIYNDCNNQVSKNMLSQSDYPIIGKLIIGLHQGNNINHIDFSGCYCTIKFGNQDRTSVYSKEAKSLIFKEHYMFEFEFNEEKDIKNPIIMLYSKNYLIYNNFMGKIDQIDLREFLFQPNLEHRKILQLQPDDGYKSDNVHGDLEVSILIVIDSIKNTKMNDTSKVKIIKSTNQENNDKTSNQSNTTPVKTQQISQQNQDQKVPKLLQQQNQEKKPNLSKIQTQAKT